MNNELFRLYLEQVNHLDEDGKRKVKRSRKLIRSIDLILIMILGFSAGIITIWNVVQEIALKLR